LHKVDTFLNQETAASYEGVSIN